MTTEHGDNCPFCRLDANLALGQHRMLLTMAQADARRRIKRRRDRMLTILALLFAASLVIIAIADGWGRWAAGGAALVIFCAYWALRGSRGFL